MANASGKGPKPDKVWNPNMPVEHLTEVLPSDSNLLRALMPTAPITQTGAILGWHELTGTEPYLFDADEFVFMGDLSAGMDGTHPNNIVPMNGDLYVFGYSESLSGDVTVRWDAETRSWTDLTANSPINPDITYGAVTFNGDIYFGYVDWDPYTYGVAVLDGATDQITRVNVPVAGIAYRPQVNGNYLVIPGEFANGVDVILYDPAAAAGSQFRTFSMPNNATAFGNMIGNAGNYTYILGQDENYRVQLYSINVNTGAVAVAVDHMNAYHGELEGIEFYQYGSLNGDLYIAHETDDGASQILKADDQTGLVSVVYSTTADGILFNTMFSIMEETSTDLWYGSNGTGNLLRIDSSGGATNYATGANNIFGVEVLNGTVYVSAVIGSTSAIYSLSSTGSLTFVSDFAGSGYENLIGTIDNHLVVFTDANGDGRGELWTSDQPSINSDWTQISPADVAVSAQYINMLSGDFIL